MSSERHTIDWHAVVRFAALLSCAAALLIFAPVLVQEIHYSHDQRMAIQSAKAERLAALEYAALGPCDDQPVSGYYRELDLLLDKELAADPVVAIDILPSFFPERGVRLLGDGVYYTSLDASVWQQIRRGPPFRAPATPITASRNAARLTSQTATSVAVLLTDSIRNAHPVGRGGMDGVIYRFVLPDGACGKMWSPTNDSRAFRLLAILEKLMRHSLLSDRAALAASDRQILQMVRDIDLRDPVPAD